MLFSMSRYLSTVFNLKAARRELVLCAFASYFVDAFAEKIDSRKTSPTLRVHTNTAKQYTPESTDSQWKHHLLYQDPL